MSNEGNHNRTLLLLILILVYCQTILTKSPSMLRGGLVYQEKITQGPVYVNVESITLFRKTDPSILVESMQTSRSIANLYQKVCRDVANKVTFFDPPKRGRNNNKNPELKNDTYVHPFDLVFSPFKYQILDAPQVCKEMGGRRPEIRDKNSMEAIRFAAISKGVEKISAGIIYDSANNIFRFASDDVNVRYKSPFKFLEYGGYYEHGTYQAPNWEDEYSVSTYASKYPIIYNQPSKEFTIRLGDTHDKGFRDYIMCELPKQVENEEKSIKVENNLMLQLTNHACRRDEAGLMASIRINMNEIEAITNLNITLPEDLNAMDYFLPTVDQSYEFEDYSRRRRRAANKKRSQRCFPEGQPIFTTSLESDDDKMTALTDLDKKTEENNWKDILPNMDVIQLHTLYQIETKAHRISYPFKLWLQRAALKLFYHEKRMENFWRDNEEKIFHHPSIAPIFESNLKDIEKASRQVMPKYDIKQYAHQHRRHQWFRRVIEEQIRIHLFKYLTTDQIGLQTRWQNYDLVTANLRSVTRVKREEDDPVHLNIAQLFNIYVMRKYAGVIDPDFQNWIQRRALAVYYSHNSNLKFLNDNRARIGQLCTYYPILSHNNAQIEKAAKKLMSRQILIQHAEQYLKDGSYRRRTDESISNMVRQYLLTDIRDGISRWTFYAAITQAIEKEQYVIGTTRMTTVTTSTSTRTTTKRTTTTGRSTTTVTTTTTARTVGVTYPPIPPTPAIRDSHTRTRRTPLGPLAAIGIGAGLTAAANAVSSSITGDAPLSWGGQALGTIFGLKTDGPEDLRALRSVGQAMEDVTINQNQIANTVNNINKQMSTIANAVDGYTKSTGTILIEQDLKMYIRHLNMVQQHAIQKYAHVLLAASVHQTSPFALAQKELDKVADDLKARKGIILARDLSATRMTGSIIEGELYLQIEIPIINENNLFNFYQVKPAPVFNNNISYLPDIDANAIAISKSGSAYVIVNNDEFETCTNRPWQCKVSTPIIPMSQQSHCVASSYVTRQTTCQLEEMEIMLPPFFHIDGNHTIYSVPKETKLYVKCSENNLSARYRDESVTIKGTGEAVFKHSCTVTLPDGSTFTTPASKSTESTSDLKIFELLKVYPIPTGVTIKHHSTAANHSFEEISLRDVEVPTQAELTYEAFHPMKSIPFLIRLACIMLAAIVMVFACRCFWPNLRSWLGRTWYCCCFGPTSQEQEEHRREENSRKLQALTDELNVIRDNVKIGAQKWKSSTSSIFGNIQKARSMSNLYKKDKDPEVQHDLLDSCGSLPPPPPPMTPTLKHTRIVYKAEPPCANAGKRVSFNTGREQ